MNEVIHQSESPVLQAVARIEQLLEFSTPSIEEQEALTRLFAIHLFRISGDRLTRWAGLNDPQQERPIVPIHKTSNTLAHIKCGDETNIHQPIVPIGTSNPEVFETTTNDWFHQPIYNHPVTQNLCLQEGDLFNPVEVRKKIPALESLEYINSNHGIIFTGPTNSGKSRAINDIQRAIKAQGKGISVATINASKPYALLDTLGNSELTLDHNAGTINLLELPSPTPIEQERIPVRLKTALGLSIGNCDELTRRCNSGQTEHLLSSLIISYIRNGNPQALALPSGAICDPQGFAEAVGDLEVLRRKLESRDPLVTAGNLINAMHEIYKLLPGSVQSIWHLSMVTGLPLQVLPRNIRISLIPEGNDVELEYTRALLHNLGLLNFPSAMAEPESYGFKDDTGRFSYLTLAEKHIPAKHPLSKIVRFGKILSNFARKGGIFEGPQPLLTAEMLYGFALSLYPFTRK